MESSNTSRAPSFVTAVASALRAMGVGCRNRGLRPVCTLLAALFILGSAGIARAEAPADAENSGVPASSRATAYAGAGGQVSPAGVFVGAGAGYRHVLSRGPSPRDEHAYVEGGAGLTATPSFVAPAVHGQWSPAPFFSLRAEYELLAFLGTTRGIVSLDSSDAGFGARTLDALPVESGVGHKLQLSPTLYARTGRVLFQSRLDAAHYRHGGRGPVFYEVQHDTLVRRGDVVLSSRTDVLFALWQAGGEPRVLAGPSYDFTRALGTEVQRQRTSGLLVIKTSDAWGLLQRPTIFVDVGVNAQDRNRDGQLFAALGLRSELR